jgi:hypothetical protein
MKLAVTRYDGDTEIIVLTEPVTVTESQYQPHIHSADGMDYYFRRDGFYDGWGRGCCGWTGEQAKTLLRSIEEQRKRIPLTTARFLSLKARNLLRTFRWWKGYILQETGYPRWGQR